MEIKVPEEKEKTAAPTFKTQDDELDVKNTKKNIIFSFFSFGGRPASICKSLVFQGLSNVMKKQNKKHEIKFSQTTFFFPFFFSWKVAPGKLNEPTAPQESPAQSEHFLTKKECSFLLLLFLCIFSCDTFF